MKAQNAAAMRAYRIINGRQKTIPIPTEVFAAALEAESLQPLVDFLGDGLVAAIAMAAKQS
ncbi:hypothetical protein [Amycolatopsis kentuckyensis]|uniref:hypothetical protein n=1 Tax=Amycolatopsis kentuckyensis TaxID=218823 RepID=UPI001178B748|nr:hypothetical protein [Amycolatopsis kentuckyensis]